MKIKLETVRALLKEAFGFESYIASFVREVLDDDTQPTACITRDGLLRVNPAFVHTYVQSKQDLFCLLFHELLHPMLGHFVFDAGPIENIATDAIINALISTVYAGPSNDGSLFGRFYADHGLQGLLRPHSRMSHSRYDKVYDLLYSRYRDANSMTTGELIVALKALSQGEHAEDIVLIGSHHRDTDALNRLEKDNLSRFAGEIQQSLRSQASRQVGHNDSLLAMILEALRTHLTMRKALLQRFATQRKIDRFKESLRQHRTAYSPFPLRPAKRDLILLAANHAPAYYRNERPTTRQRNQGLAIYLDVSGSVNDELPRILGLLRNLRREITSIFLFSNQVVEVPFETLLKGHLQTTLGTDFNCVAQSILEQGYDKAVVITDGYAALSEDIAKQLRERKVSLLTVLFDRAQSCEALAPFGEVVLLDDISEHKQSA